MSVDAFEAAWAWLAEAEGGGRITKHPHDRGGLTKWGVTQGAFDQAKILKLIPAELQTVAELNETQARAVFRGMYWSEIHGDELPLPFAFAVADAAFHSGPDTAIRHLQEVLRVAPDGIIGRQTVNAARNHGLAGLDLYLARRCQHFASIVALRPSQQVWLRGWFARLFRLQRRIMALMQESAVA